ncbi:MAG TPA: DEAD/DEAH box helicase family protein [Kamptonema sp.]|nr:DEAD/DEAH box helicase family protein [Kamptonema sp.]
MTEFGQQFTLLSEQISQPFELRQYQQRIINELYNQIRKGTKRILVYAPTGSGKTAIACRVMLQALTKGLRILFLIHRDPLVEQTRASLIRDGIAAELIGILKAGYKEERASPIQIASIQTLARRKFPQGIELIIADECHTVCWYDT